MIETENTVKIANFIVLLVKKVVTFSSKPTTVKFLTGCLISVYTQDAVTTSSSSSCLLGTTQEYFQIQI